MIVLAAVESGEVVVEAKLSKSCRALSGEVRILEAAGPELAWFNLGLDGPTRFSIGAEAADGLAVEVCVGYSHENYGILTPDDIAADAEADR